MMLFKNQNNSDKELIKSARKDPTQFALIFEKYGDRIFSYLFSHTRHQQEAEDITAQTFLVAMESIQQYRGDGDFCAWLFGIARNKLMDHFRQSRQVSSLENIEIPVSSNTLDNVIHSEEISRLSEFLNALPEEDQELLRLRFVGEMSFPEMSVLLGKKEDTIKKSVYRLMAKLQSRMKE
jgi:RNA polymerase sigma-70 factor (ECF subfamily)